MEVYLAPVGTGKTDAVQQRILDLKLEKPLASVWVLLATERQITDFRRRLMARETGNRVSFNIEYFNFYTLYRRILSAAGEPQRRLSDPARYGVMRLILDELCERGDLTLFSGIARTPGFVRIAADFIYELKQSLIDHETFSAAAARTNDAKLHELARIYADYQAALVTNDLVDREGEGWVALSVMARNPNVASAVDLLVCDGYDQFNPLQARLLTMLGARVQASITTLTTVPGRESGVGRRFKRALDGLMDCHTEENVDYDMQLRWELYESGAAALQDRPIRQLADQFFAATVKPFDTPTDAVKLIEAPDPRAETSAVLRDVKRRLLDGVRPDDILIAVRDWNLYGRAFAAQGAAYGVPLLLHHGEPLIENPAMAALLDLLDLHMNDFKRRELLDVLRSPYFMPPHLSPPMIDALDVVTRAAFVTGGRADVLGAIQSHTSLIDEDEIDDERDVLIDPVTADLLRAALDMFFDAVTPPARAAVSEYVRWLERLIGDDDIADPDQDGSAPDEPVSTNGVEAIHDYALAMIERVRVESSTRLVARDLVAFKAFKNTLKGMINAETLIRALRTDADDRVAWADFWGALKTTLAARSMQYGDIGAPGRDGRVLVTLVTDARGLPHPHVFIVGLSEGVFPASVAEDPLLLDSERHDMQRFGINLRTTDQRADEDSLFYELINLASETLTLSRFTVDNGNQVLPSPLWNGVRAVLPGAAVKRQRLGEIVGVADAATIHEVAAAAMKANDEDARGLAAWLNTAHHEMWTRIRFGQRIEAGRMARGTRHDQYSGVLTDAGLIARVRVLLGSDRIWSATQFNEYGTCGFRFFARRMLKLEKLKTPEQGMDRAQFGQIIHKVLEDTYKQVHALTPDDRDHALFVLDEKLNELLPGAPERFGFRRSALWTQEQAMIKRRLQQLITADFNDDLKFKHVFDAQARAIYRLEAPFGDDGITQIDLGDEVVNVRGRIDRIDRISTVDGDALVVIDYKTGSTPIKIDEIARGRNFQMMLYVRALENWVRTQDDVPRVAGGVFLHVNSQKTSGALHIDQASDVIDAGLAHLAANIEAGRAGDFAVHANKVEKGQCAAACDYGQFCRIAVTSRRKLQS